MAQFAIVVYSSEGRRTFTISGEQSKQSIAAFLVKENYFSREETEMVDKASFNCYIAGNPGIAKRSEMMALVNGKVVHVKLGEHLVCTLTINDVKI